MKLLLQYAKIGRFAFYVYIQVLYLLLCFTSFIIPFYTAGDNTHSTLCYQSASEVTLPRQLKQAILKIHVFKSFFLINSMAPGIVEYFSISLSSKQACEQWNY